MLNQWEPQTPPRLAGYESWLYQMPCKPRGRLWFPLVKHESCPSWFAPPLPDSGLVFGLRLSDLTCFVPDSSEPLHVAPARMVCILHSRPSGFSRSLKPD